MLWIKSFHIVFVASWFAGLFYLPRIFVNLAMVEAGSIAEQAITTGILVLCLAILFVLFALAATIFRLLGRPGVEIVSRVFGLILSSIAVTSLVIAIKMSFGLSLG